MNKQRKRVKRIKQLRHEVKQKIKNQVYTNIITNDNYKSSYYVNLSLSEKYIKEIAQIRRIFNSVINIPHIKIYIENLTNKDCYFLFHNSKIYSTSKNIIEGLEYFSTTKTKKGDISQSYASNIFYINKICKKMFSSEIIDVYTLSEKLLDLHYKIMEMSYNAQAVYYHFGF